MNYDEWGEMYTLAVFVVSVIVGSIVNEIFMISVVAFVGGAIFGRLWFIKKSQLRMHLVFMLLAAIFGILLGRIFSNALLLIVIFSLGFGISYIAFKNRWV